MSRPDVKQFSGIFISYRRDDSPGDAGRLYDRLIEHFGEAQVFFDVEVIQPGEDFVEKIVTSVAACEILIALIGPRWLSSAEVASHRLNNPNDFVRLEITTAFNRKLSVLPVLLQGVRMPQESVLPDDLVRLLRINAIELSHLRWKHDLDLLIGTLEDILGQREEMRREAALAAEERERKEAEARRLAEETHREEEEKRKRRQDEAARRRQNGDAKRLAEQAQRLEDEKRRRREGENTEKHEARFYGVSSGASFDKFPRRVDPPISEKPPSPRTYAPTGAARIPMKNATVFENLSAGIRSIVKGVAGIAILVVLFNPAARDVAQNQLLRLRNIFYSPSPSPPPININRVFPRPTPTPTPQSSPTPEFINSFGLEFYRISSNSITLLSSDVTNAQWQKVMGKSFESPVESKLILPNHPVRVLRRNADEFIRKLTLTDEENEYRLPTSLERQLDCPLPSSQPWSFLKGTAPCDVDFWAKSDRSKSDHKVRVVITSKKQ